MIPIRPIQGLLPLSSQAKAELVERVVYRCELARRCGRQFG